MLLLFLFWLVCGFVGVVFGGFCWCFGVWLVLGVVLFWGCVWLFVCWLWGCVCWWVGFCLWVLFGCGRGLWGLCCGFVVWVVFFVGCLFGLGWCLWFGCGVCVFVGFGLLFVGVFVLLGVLFGWWLGVGLWGVVWG